jgi:hypothetical protein
MIAKTIFFTACLLLFLDNGFSQCTPILDTNDVKRIAKRRRIYWNKLWHSPPTMSYDAQKCQWTFEAEKEEFTREGLCKHTKGCSITTIVTLILDARTGQEIYFIEERKLWPHYE